MASIELPLEPHEPDYTINLECPECGRELHEGDKVYRIMTRKGKPFPTYEIIGCEYCIEDLAEWVEDL